MRQSRSGDSQRPTVITTYSSGATFFGLLFLLFLGLKLGGIIDWPWLWVVAPLWAPWSIIVVLFFIVALLYFMVSLLYALVLWTYHKINR